MTYLVGIIGFDGCGKTTLRNFIIRYLADKGVNAVGISMSQPIAEDLFPLFGDAVYKKPFSPDLRDYFIRYGQSMKQIHGESYWIDRAINSLSVSQVGIVDGIRFEIECSAGFNRLIYIEPSPDTLPENLSSCNVPIWFSVKAIAGYADIRLPYHPSKSDCESVCELILSEVQRNG
jgi:hypothetical protein